ncbi:MULTISPECIES: hypothetical protein [unclassified Paenibacillus]|uniref:hypothetical protein n=1 Tax=unclassified Paenibacillus TaxID=185978 RepID=UPI001C119757|nr:MULTISPECIES: hypothetical protein [unclassified Paenibacillus]MBU5440568.1 hypothetical protein [Paenibacillus sp. MSJ-34]CAH0120034.1 hypothetical protein PAE9249_02547 [Paenibacillus sp. CECT 9249]
MNDLIGKRVQIFYGDHMQYKVSGTIDEWDENGQYVRLEPEGIVLQFQDIAKIELLEAVDRIAESPAPSYHAGNIRFVMRNSVQFDNAILFRSAVSVWKDNRMLVLEGIIAEHSEDTVTMTDGRQFPKSECQFVVKSILGSRG